MSDCRAAFRSSFAYTMFHSAIAKQFVQADMWHKLYRMLHASHDFMFCGHWLLNVAPHIPLLSTTHSWVMVNIFVPHSPSLQPRSQLVIKIATFPLQSSSQTFLGKPLKHTDGSNLLLFLHFRKQTMWNYVCGNQIGWNYILIMFHFVSILSLFDADNVRTARRDATPFDVVLAPTRVLS